MSLGISSRLKNPRKHELIKSHSQAQILANKLRQDGVMVEVENVIQNVDQVSALLASNISGSSMPFKETIINLCQHLKVYGAYLEILYKDQLDHAFKIFRDKAQDELRIDQLTRLHLLELIELRAKGWKGTEVMNQYYRKKVNEYSQVEMSDSATSLSESMSSMIMSTASVSPPLLGPGEVIKPSGKFNKPTRIPGKKYCKDEVVIRNADSGKVMGIKGRRVHMIEELSETIISFQRVNPGAKERLVQITGANEESIIHAKQLIEDTIRRNASPVREHGGPSGISSVSGALLTGSSSSINSSASDDSALPSSSQAHRNRHSSRAMLMHSLSTNDAHIGEYKYTVMVAGGRTIKITGDDLDLVRISKLVLDEYFSGEPYKEPFTFDTVPPQPISVPSALSETNDDADRGGLSSSSSPLPPGGGPAVLTNGQSEDTTDGVRPSTLRRPHVPIEDIIQGRITATPVHTQQVLTAGPLAAAASSSTLSSSISVAPTAVAVATESSHAAKSNAVGGRKRSIAGDLAYSIEKLAGLGMSPFCLMPPDDWEKIAKEYPFLIRHNVLSFNAKEYLQMRTAGEPTCVLSADEVDGVAEV